MSHSKHILIEETEAREIVITRVISAPRALVFEAWTDPKHLDNWFGPRGFRNETHAIDVRPGGVWRFTMHGPNGTDFPNRIIFDKIVKPELITYAHDSGKENDETQFQVIVAFDEQDGKTTLTLRSIFPTAEQRDFVVREYHAIEGGNQNLDRFEEQVAILLAGSEFVVTRTFDAPRDLVYRAWTEPEALAQWWGPKGFKMLNLKLDLRPGGIFLYGMQAPDGSIMWGKFLFREITAPERLVFVDSFSDEKGGTTRAPFAGDWPLEMLSTVILTEKTGKTTLTLRGVPINATATERKTYEDGYKSMQMGWKGTLDQLEAYLATTGRK